MPETQPSAPNAVWTCGKVLAWMVDAFQKKGIGGGESPRLLAEMLLSHVLKTERVRLYTDLDRPLEATELATLRGYAGRALKDEPIQYIIGEGWFFGLPFTVDRRVLIPRPCTETLVETVLQRARLSTQHPLPEGGGGGWGSNGTGAEKAAAPHQSLTILDLCTGSGCIAIALAKRLKQARVVATDLSPGALDIARHNAVRHGVADRIDFREGNLWQPIGEDERFDVIAANPPYIPDHEWDAVPSNVKDHEPTSALRGGPDGLHIVRPILERAPAHLNPGGLLMIEIAACTAGAAVGLAGAWNSTRIVKDLEGHERFLACE